MTKPRLQLTLCKQWIELRNQWFVLNERFTPRNIFKQNRHLMPLLHWPEASAKMDYYHSMIVNLEFNWLKTHSIALLKVRFYQCSCPGQFYAFSRASEHRKERTTEENDESADVLVGVVVSRKENGQGAPKNSEDNSYDCLDRTLSMLKSTNGMFDW